MLFPYRRNSCSTSYLQGGEIAMDLILGLITGFLFGFFLQKGQVLRYEKQVGFLRLKDMTVIKFMFSAIVTGMIGIYLFKDIGVIELSLKATQIMAQVIGGVLFGIGWAIFGYCPGTAIGALGEGRLHVLWGVFGMLFGAAVYAEIYPSLKSNLLKYGDFGKITLPGILGINHWVVILIFSVLVILFFRYIEKREL